MGLLAKWKEDGIDRLESELAKYQDLLDTYGDEEYAQMVKIITAELEKERGN